MAKTASCNCGSLTVDVSGQPEAVVACHCTDCQRRTGSVLGVGAYYADAQVKISGPRTSFTRGCASGRSLTQNFCPTCGTSVYWTADLKPNVVGVAVGCFADPQFPPPVRSVWEQTQHPWLGLPDGIVHYPKGRSA